MTVTASNHLFGVGVDRKIREWDLVTVSLIAESPPLKEEAVCLDASKDCQSLAMATANRTLQLLDISKVNEPAVRWTSPAQTLAFSSVMFSPSGKSIATSTHDPLNWRAGGEVKLWEAETGKELAILGPHSAEVLGVCFDAKGQRLATFGSFFDVRMWDLATMTELPRVPTQSHVVGAAFSQDGKRIVVAQSTGSVVVWSIQRQMPVQEFDGHRSTLAALAVSHDRRTVVTRDVMNQAKFWKVPDE
jgi:WD40 repeat protein